MKRVLMLLANGVEPLEMSAFTDVLGWANLVGNEQIELVDVGLRSEITTTFGLNIRPNHLLADMDVETDLDDFDALAIPGGFEPSGFYLEALSENFLQVIRHFAINGKLIASVCVSSLALGAAGILKGKKATTYHQVGGKRKKQLTETGAIFVDKPIVCDTNYITSTGPGTAVEVALLLLEKLTSKTAAEELRKTMRVATPDKNWYQTPQVEPSIDLTYFLPH